MKRKEGIVDYHEFVHVNHTQVKYRDGKLHLQIDLSNVSGKQISQIFFSISGRDDFGDQVLFQGEERGNFQLENMTFDAGMRMIVEYDLEVDDEPSDIELQAERADFSNGQFAIREKPHKKIYFYEAVEKDRYKDWEIYEHLRKYSMWAECFAEKRSDGWLCCCGRLNRIQDDFCFGCMSSRKVILTDCTKESIRREIKKEKEELKEKQREEALLKERLRRRDDFLIVAGVVLSFAVVIGLLFFILI